jgi:acyl-CoA thioester hydrolase
LHPIAYRGSKLLAEAHLRVGFVSPDGKPCRQPQSWRDAFSQVLLPEETA